ncbi:MAG TPA: NADP-dependent oxidoreductase [Kineosporiaceae bacterium]
MRAAFYQEYGGPDVLTVGELPAPKVGPSELLVRVRSASVNPVDWKIASGRLDTLLEVVFPVVPGWDVAGVVEAVGLDTPEFAVGDEVFAYARKDLVHGGTLAELVTVPVRAVARKPAALSWTQAGALPLAGLTAYQMLTRLGVRRGDVVLVHAASGGIGCLAVQVAHASGARVIGTASARNHDLVRDLGGEPVAYGPGVVDRVRELAPRGVDLVVDLVGGVLDVTRAVLASGGRHGSIVDRAVASAGGLYGWVRPSAAGLTALARLADDDGLRVPIAATFALDDVPDAWRMSREGQVAGKIAIDVSGVGSGREGVADALRPLSRRLLLRGSARRSAPSPSAGPVAGGVR